MTHCSIYPDFDKRCSDLPPGLRKIRCNDYLALFQNRFEEPRGVVPKFKGQRQWTSSDEEKLFIRSDHKFYQLGRTFLRTQNPDLDESSIEELARCENWKIKMRGHISQTQPKFTKWHWIKFYYSTNNGKVIPESGRFHVRIGGVTIDIPIIRHILHFIAKLFNTRSVKEVNWEVIKEALCYDLYEIIGFGGEGQSAKAAVIVSTYADGKKRLLLDSTEARGPEGEKPYDFRDQIKCPEKTLFYARGRLNRNRVFVDGTEYPIDEEDLARMYASMLFLGDWDKIGAKGDNLLFYIDKKTGKARLLNIDPGRALETQSSIGWCSMIRNRNIGSDGRIIYPSRTHPFLGRLANFTLLADTTLVQRIGALKYIAARRDQALEVISDYQAALKDNFEGVDTELSALKTLLIARFDYLAEVLAPYKNCCDGQLSMLDHLEQITSESRTTIGEGDQQVELCYPEVIPASRREWRLKDGRYVFEGSSRDCAEVTERLVRFNQGSSTPVVFSRFGNEVRVADNFNR